MDYVEKYYSLINQLEFSFKKKNKIISSYAYKAAKNECSESLIKAVAKHPSVSIKQLATATKTIHDFNFMLDNYTFTNGSRPEENGRNCYIDLVDNTKSKKHLVFERVKGFNGL